MSDQKVTKENAIASVQSSASSIFSKEDVLNLIEQIEVKQVTEIKYKGISQDKIHACIENCVQNLENSVRDLVDTYNIEFELTYDKRIEVTDVDVDIDYIRGVLVEEFAELMEEDEDSGEHPNQDYIGRAFKVDEGYHHYYIASFDDGQYLVSWDNGSTHYPSSHVDKLIGNGTWKFVK